MEYKLFKPDGKPLRTTISAQAWMLDCRFDPKNAQPDARSSLLAHELTHVVRAGVTVRAWHIRKKQTAQPRLSLSPPARRPPGGAQPFLPEVDDEVLIVFQSGTPHASAVMFNPKEYTLGHSTPWESQGDVGMIREGSYRVVVKRRGGMQGLALALILSRDKGRRPEFFPLT